MLVGVAGLVLLSNAGLFGIEWPWEKVDLPDVLTEETAVAQPEEAVIYEIEPITLDCRARIRASVPVEGRREHKLVGQVYRTDTVTMNAVGDIDTCVDSSKTAVVRVDGESFQVVVPASAITFERPRVDAVASRESVQFDKGLVGKLTDVFPWVSENSGLTPAAYAFAQEVVGSSECMERAWDVTALVIGQAYRNQLAEQGGDPENIDVHISGSPRFGDVPTGQIDEFDFEVGATVDCRLDNGAFTADVVSEPDGRL